jgi:hypothetical protein
MRLLQKVQDVATLVKFDIREWLTDRWQVRIRRSHKRVLRATPGTLTDARDGHFAIVAIYPSDDSLLFTINLLDSLSAAHFWVLVISTRQLGTGQLAKIRGRSHHVIERAAVGRDFGSYQMGLEWLERHKQLKRSGEVLILANDSMFYPKAFTVELLNMLRRQADWQSLFESYEPHYHAQSFFLLLRPPLLRSAVFWRFWAQYKPYSARLHCINRGEVSLSICLTRGGFVCEPAYSSVRLDEALREKPLPLLDLLDLVPTGDHWDVSAGVLFNSMMDVERSFPITETVGGGETRALAGASRAANVLLERRRADLPASWLPRQRAEWLLWERWVARLIHRFEGSNPTHVGALLCNRLLAAPIKRDVCYRGTLDINQTVRMATGFDADEMAAMHRDLRSRGLGLQMSGPRRWLFGTGRI